MRRSCFSKTTIGLFGLLLLMPVAKCPAAMKADRPNILFAISDAQSYPHAGAYRCTWVKTPAFDRVATQGILFRNCYTPNAKCAPSRSCILTGRNTWQLEEACNHWPKFPAKFATFMGREKGFYERFMGGERLKAGWVNPSDFEK